MLKTPLNYRNIFSVSIVSHGHRNYVLTLLDDLTRSDRRDLEIILTWNLKDEVNTIDAASYPFNVISIVNSSPQGFAQNHNAAFNKSSGDNFVVLNPDIRLPEDPFHALLNVVSSRPNSICAPLILNADYEREDSARFFPSPWILLKKAAAKICGIPLELQAIPCQGRLLNPDWIAGMFMVIPRRIYTALGGLSERYFLYYEDVDFCARARLQRFDILVTKDAIAIHDARRDSHKNPRFLVWHMASALKFFTSRPYLSIGLKMLFKRQDL